MKDAGGSGGVSRPRHRRFLELGGAGLAGAALLGVACCGGKKDEALVRPVFSDGEGSEALRDQIRKFNQQNRGAIEVALRLAPADSGQYFEILSSVPVITLGREAIRSVRPRPVTPLYHDMSLAIAERFHASLAGIVTPERSERGSRTS